MAFVVFSSLSTSEFVRFPDIHQLKLDFSEQTNQLEFFHYLHTRSVPRSASVRKPGTLYDSNCIQMAPCSLKACCGDSREMITHRRAGSLTLITCNSDNSLYSSRESKRSRKILINDTCTPCLENHPCHGSQTYTITARLVLSKACPLLSSGAFDEPFC